MSDCYSPVEKIWASLYPHIAVLSKFLSNRNRIRSCLYKNGVCDINVHQLNTLTLRYTDEEQNSINQKNYKIKDVEYNDIPIIFSEVENNKSNKFYDCNNHMPESKPTESLTSLNKQRNSHDLMQRLQNKGIPLEKVDLKVDDFILWLNDHSDLRDRYARMNDVFIEKCLEHYIAYLFTGVKPGDVYIDVAAAGSNWASILHKRGVDAYSLDLSYPAVSPDR